LILLLSDIIEEYNNGKQNWVTSCDENTGEIKPGVITWAGVTKKSTKVIKLVLSNGRTITCTPEHQFPVFGKGFVPAQDLIATDEIISLHFLLPIVHASFPENVCNSFR
jgi:intein/homing endonuclease